VIDDCDFGFQDANGIAGDGCEYLCIITSGAHEICDGVDNDCDTETDEDCESLVLYLSFDEGVGTTVNDSSAYGNDGTSYGGVSFTTDAISGRALEFDGVDDYVEIVNSPSLNFSDNFTVMFWIWYEPQEGRASGIINHGMACCQPYRSWDFQVPRWNPNQVTFAWTPNGTDIRNILTGHLRIRTWEQLTLTFEWGRKILC
jgi:hypothetical protein